MEFNLKKLANDASGLFNRAKQLTEEKLLHAEKTEYDPQLEQLLAKADRAEEQTRKLLSALEAYIQPNIALRMGEVLTEKLELKKDEKPNNLEQLGQAMQDAGQTFGVDTAFGAVLVKVAQTQLKLGAAERELVQMTSNQTISQFRRFLDCDIKNVQKERRVLQNKRLDLDAAKSRLKRARTLESQASAEADLRVAQTEFDRQIEILRILLESAQSSQNQLSKNILEFVEAQASFYANGQQHMADLKRELSSRSNGLNGEGI